MYCGQYLPKRSRLINGHLPCFQCSSSEHAERVRVKYFVTRVRVSTEKHPHKPTHFKLASLYSRFISHRASRLLVFPLNRRLSYVINTRLYIASAQPVLYNRAFTMASFQNLDDKTRSLIERSYPQTKDAQNDVVKLSSAAFPDAEVKHACYRQEDNRLTTSSTRLRKRPRLSNGLLQPLTLPLPAKTQQRLPRGCPRSTHTSALVLRF